MNHTGERHIDGMVGGKPSSFYRLHRQKLIHSGAGNIGYDEGVLRPDLLIVEAGRSMVVNPKRRERETALLGKPPHTWCPFFPRISLVLALNFRRREQHPRSAPLAPPTMRPISAPARASSSTRSTLVVQDQSPYLSAGQGTLGLPPLSSEQDSSGYGLICEESD